VGGGRLKFEEKTSTKTAGLEKLKIHFNSTISTKDAKFAVGDIGNFYMNSKLELSEYMRIHFSMIPQKIIDEYDVMKYVEANGYVYVKITGAMDRLWSSDRVPSD